MKERDSALAKVQVQAKVPELETVPVMGLGPEQATKLARYWVLAQVQASAWVTGSLQVRELALDLAPEQESEPARALVRDSEPALALATEQAQVLGSGQDSVQVQDSELELESELATVLELDLATEPG